MAASRDGSSRWGPGARLAAVLFGWAVVVAYVPDADAAAGPRLSATPVEVPTLDGRVGSGPSRELGPAPILSLPPAPPASARLTAVARALGVPVRASAAGRYTRWGTSLPPPSVP